MGGKPGSAGYPATSLAAFSADSCAGSAGTYPTNKAKAAAADMIIVFMAKTPIGTEPRGSWYLSCDRYQALRDRAPGREASTRVPSPQADPGRSQNIAPGWDPRRRDAARQHRLPKRITLDRSPSMEILAVGRNLMRPCRRSLYADPA
jgi:hypothetical protein